MTDSTSTEKFLNKEAFLRLSLKKQAEYTNRLKAVKGRESLIYLCREILGYDRIEDSVHRKLENVLLDDRKRKLIMLPRGSFKSTIGTIGFSIFKLLNNPNLRILIDSEVLENAQKFVGQIKRHLTDLTFRKIFGNLVDKKQRETAREFTVKRESKNLKEPSVYATGVGTGKRRNAL